MGPAIVVALWLAAAAGLDASARTTPAGADYDAVVVAGAGVRRGGVPSGTLIRRTERGADLVLAEVAPVLALTGGIGDWGPAESVVAKAVAEARGVPADRIVLETRSTNTESNARIIREVLGNVRVLVVTDRFHAYRCGRVFGRHFDDVDVVGVRGPPAPRVWGAVREVAAVMWYAWTGRLG
ncbi:MAG: YdcF family protein [Myxococcota bacterium]